MDGKITIRQVTVNGAPEQEIDITTNPDKTITLRTDRLKNRLLTLDADIARLQQQKIDFQSLLDQAAATVSVPVPPNP